LTGGFNSGFDGDGGLGRDGGIGRDGGLGLGGATKKRSRGPPGHSTLWWLWVSPPLVASRALRSWLPLASSPAGGWRGGVGAASLSTGVALAKGLRVAWAWRFQRASRRPPGGSLWLALPALQLPLASPFAAPPPPSLNPRGLHSGIALINPNVNAKHLTNTKASLRLTKRGH
jgi:hypothetical protein